MKKILITIVYVISLSLYADNVVSVEVEEVRDRDWSRAISQMFISNLVVWSWDRFVIQAPWAVVSLESWENNLRDGFSWDNSLFFTNQILHPYQGGLYFSSARNNDFNWWESTAFSFTGSMMWEYFCERYNPSINDLITTTFGGIAMGETSYRLSSLILDHSKTGRDRVIREVVTLGINPVGRINSWIYGDEESVKIDGRRPPFNLQVLTGLSSASEAGEWKLSEDLYSYLGLRFQYGSLYYQRSPYTPYDYFFFNLGCDVNTHNPTMDFFAHALIIGKKLYPGENNVAVAGIFQHFDYIENSVYKFASNGAGAGIQFLFPFSEDRSLETMVHFSGVALAGVDSEYTEILENKDYSMGPGFSGKFGLVFKNDPFFTVSLMYNRYWFTTLSGADNYNTVGVGGAAFEYNVTKSIKLGVMSRIYDRWSDAGIDNVQSNALRLYLINQI